MHINPDTKFVLQKMSVKDGLSVPAINHLEEKVSFDSNDTIEGFYVMNMDETVSSDEGEYTIDSRVMERGGTSMVFKGRNKEGKPIAVKIGEPFFYNDDVFGDSAESVFIREALVAKQLKLQHPDLLIPDVLDYTVVTVDSTNLKGDRNEEDDWEAQESCPALVTQWIDGDKLYDNYGVHRFKNSEELIETFEKLGRTIDLIHEYGIIHEDVKGPNVIIDSKGDPYLVDWGLSNWTTKSTRSHKARNGRYAYTSSTHGGTPNYLPNSVRLEQKWRPSDEVYSFAVTLYYTLCDQFPRNSRDISSSYIPLEDQLDVIQPIKRSTFKKLDEVFKRVFLNDAFIPPKEKVMPRYKSCKSFMRDIALALR